MKKGTGDNNQEHHLRTLINQGARLLGEGKAEDAILFFEQVLELDAGNVAALINLGGAYIVAGQHRRAIPPLESARDLEPHNAMIWINLGAAYLGNPLLATPQKQFQAIEAFEQALELNPAAPNVHYNLGLIFVERGDTDLAVAALQQALQVNPHDDDARYWLNKLENREEGETDV